MVILLRRLMCIFAAALLVLPMSGCWDMRDINERSYILGIGIDRLEGDMYRFTFNSYLPVTAGASAKGDRLIPQITVIDSTSPALAVRAYNETTSCEAVLEQLACIAVFDSCSGEELLSLLDSAFRDPRVRRQCVVVAADGSAHSLISADPGESAAPVAIEGLLKQQDTSRRHTRVPSLFRLGPEFQSGGNFMLYKLAASRSSELLSTSDAVPDTISITGAVVYAGMERRGVIDRNDTELAALFANRKTRGTLSVQSGDGTPVYYEIERSCCAISCDIADEKLIFTADITIDCSLADSGGSAVPDMDQLGNSVKTQLDALVAKCTAELGAVPLGFDNAVRQQHWKWYKLHRAELYERMADSIVTVNIECRTDSGGSIL